MSDAFAYYVSVTYDQIKLKKVTMKYWVRNPVACNPPVVADNPNAQNEILTLYDPDSNGRSMTHEYMLLSESCKHRLLHHGRTHKLSLYPKYARDVFIPDKSESLTKRVEVNSPWFDVASIFSGSRGSMKKPTGCSYNGYLIALRGGYNGQHVAYTLTHTFLCKGKRRCSQYIT